MTSNFSNTKYAGDPQRRGRLSVAARGGGIGSDSLHRMLPSHHDLGIGVVAIGGGSEATKLLGWLKSDRAGAGKLTSYLSKIFRAQMAGGTRRKFCEWLHSILPEKEWGDPTHDETTRLGDWRRMQGGFDRGAAEVGRANSAGTWRTYQEWPPRMQSEGQREPCREPHRELDPDCFNELNRGIGHVRGETSSLHEPHRSIRSGERRGMGLTDGCSRRAIRDQEAREREEVHRPPLPSTRVSFETRRRLRDTCSVIDSREERSEISKELAGCIPLPEPSGILSKAAYGSRASVARAQNRGDAVSLSGAIPRLVPRSLEPTNGCPREVYSDGQKRGSHKICAPRWASHLGVRQRTVTRAPDLEAVSI